MTGRIIVNILYFRLIRLSQKVTLSSTARVKQQLLLIVSARNPLAEAFNLSPKTYEENLELVETVGFEVFEDYIET